MDEKENETETIEASERPNPVYEHFFGTAEKTVARSAVVSDSQYSPYNPDDLYQKKGNYSIYEDMEKDDQVDVCLQLKLDLVLGSGWTIQSDDSGDQAITDDIYSRLAEDLEVPLETQLEEFLRNAWAKGFSLSEKKFKFKPDNTICWDNLITRHPQTWLLHTDIHGNVEKYEQYGANGETIRINPKSLVHYVNRGQYQNPFGRSDLRSAYDAWFVKRHIIRFYSIFLEKYASPIPHAKYDPNVIKKAKVQEMLDILKRFQTKTALVYPKTLDLAFLEAQGKGDAYTGGINLFNMFIGRSLLTPDLLGFSGSESQGGGSQALGRAQMNVFFKTINRRRKAIENIVNRNIVQPMVIWNHGDVKFFPKFKLNPISDDQAIEYAKVFLDAVKGKVYKPNDEEINHFRNSINFPEGDVEQPDKDPPPFGQVPGNMPMPGQDPKPMDNPEDMNNGDPGKKDFAFSATDGSYAQKVNFKALNQQLDTSENVILSAAKPLIEDIFDDYLKQIERKRILEGRVGKPEKIATLKLKFTSKLRSILHKQWKDHYVKSRMLARSELFVNKFTQPLPSDRFLEFLDKETFQYIGDWEYQVTKDARIAMMNAIRDGKPLSSVVDIIDSETKKKSLVSLERYSRTKTTEVMNRARLEEFDSSGVVNGYQYSAILDDRTTPICEGLHGKKFVRGTEPVPPMHFNCRSLLIPITIFEEFKPDSRVGRRSISDFIEEEKGKGFATK